MFSKACEYAIKSVIYITQEALAGRKTNVKQIAIATDSPEAFVGKILQPLSKEGILVSTKGKQGGFSVDLEKIENVKIFEIVKIIDGEEIFKKCGLGLKQCSSENPCPVHDDYKIIKEKLLKLTQKYSLYDLALKTEQGLAWLKN